MPAPTDSNGTNKRDLPPRSLDVLRQLATCVFMFTQDLGLASDSIVQALITRGFATKSIQAISSDGSILAEGQERDSATKTRQIIQITEAGRAFVNHLSN